MSILIKNILLQQEITDIFIEGNSIREVGKSLACTAQKIIDGKGKAVIPGLINGHTHAAMTLARGYGDDIPLEQWLNERIWPYETNLTPEDVYWGTKLACLEMIKSGTTCFCDMYTYFDSTAKATEEMGLRAVLAATMFDYFDKKQAAAVKQQMLNCFGRKKKYGNRIIFALGPHAIYTVSTDSLRWCRNFAQENGLFIHLHLAETQSEYNNALQQLGLSPVRYLHKHGLLSPRLIIAHGVWVDEEEIRLLADYGVSVVHNPNSNLKIASGYQFKYEEMKAAGITVCLGTDGCASSNSLDMIETMKTAALMQKAWRFDATAMPAEEVLDCATVNGAKMLQLNIGKIAPNCLADLCLVDLNSPAFTPNFNFVSNLIYAANGSCIDTVICDGKVLMENKYVPGEEEIMQKAAAVAYDLMKKPTNVIAKNEANINENKDKRHNEQS
ncbi:MAG: amidohydrolase [Prevotellaceae bacterium]|jgi:5-methylthioadenosine/S-adenosylhomocysteine deaminase|nr:amidohydrolase [Prevotellaceae bacterium]